MPSSRRRERVVVDARLFTVALKQDPKDGWWVGLVQELPGCGSQGGTLEECREMLADAIHEYLVPRGDLPAHAAEATGVPAV
jgi:predicted RNase H-like HicB family nuclease